MTNKSNERFVLVDGYISMNNEKLKLDINETKKDLKNRGGWLSIFLGFVGFSIFRTFKKDEAFEKVFDYVNIGIQILGFITILVILYYILFFRKSKKNLVINQIKRIEIDKGELETELTLIFNNNRHKDLEFRTLENQIEPFIEALKKRNSRFEIKHL